MRLLWGRKAADDGGGDELGIYRRLVEFRLQEYERERTEAASTPAAPALTTIAVGAQQIGISFTAGLVLGSPYYGFRAAVKAPTKNRRAAAWAAIRQQSPQLASMFALYNLLYTVSRVGVSRLRGTPETDRTSDIIAAFLTGMTLSLRGGLAHSLRAGTLVGLFVYLLHLSPRFTPAPAVGAGNPLQGAAVTV
eukprot:RCo003131